VAEEKLIPPILLLGNVRSGTSMVQSFFAHCPGVVTWFEPRTIWMYADPGRRHDRFTAEDATPQVRRYIRARFLKQQRALGGRIMEKTPSNVLRLPYVHAIFPECKLIYIIRDPLAQVSSSEFRWQNAINPRHARRRLLETPKAQLHYYAWRAVWDHFRKKILRRKYVSVWGVRYPGIYADLRRLSREEVMAKQWAECSRQMAEDIASLPAGLVYQVRYEDLITDPVHHFRAMCAHVGIDPPAAAVEKVAQSADTSRQGKWKRLDPAAIAAILPHVQDEMARHGYETPADLPDAEERARAAARATSYSGEGSTRKGP
jgi:hypothetical protein